MAAVLLTLLTPTTATRSDMPGMTNRAAHSRNRADHQPDTSTRLIATAGPVSRHAPTSQCPRCDPTANCRSEALLPAADAGPELAARTSGPPPGRARIPAGAGPAVWRPPEHHEMPTFD